MLASALAALALLGPAGPDLVLEWDAPEGCPDGAAIERAIRRRADDRLGTAPARVRGRVHGQAGGWTLQLEVEAEEALDQRIVEDPDCATLADATALIVAITIERAPGRPGQPLPRTLADATPTAVQWPHDAPAPEPPADPAPARERRLRFGARIAAGIELGALPGVGPDLAVTGLLQRRRFVAELGARYEPPRQARYPDAPDAGGDLSLWAIAGAGCFAPAAGRVRFPLCAGLEGGGMFGRGVGVAMARRDHLAWGAGTARGGLTVRVMPWLRVAVGATLLVPWTRPRFSTELRGVVHRAGPVAGRFNVGLEIVQPPRRN